MGEFGAAMDALIARSLEAMRSVVGDAAHDIQVGGRAIAPVRLGTLRASIKVDGPREASTVPDLPKATPRGPAVFAARVGPTVVYGRIREVGGNVPGLKTRMDGNWLRWWWHGRPVFWNVGAYSYTIKKTGRTVYRKGRGRQMQHGAPYLRIATDPVRDAFVPMVVRKLTAAIEEVTG